MEVRNFNAGRELFLDELLASPATPASAEQRELLALLRSEGIVLAHAGQPLGEAQALKAFAWLLAADSSVSLEQRLEVLREVLLARRLPGAQWDLREFLISAYFSLHGRLDENVIGVYQGVLQIQDGKRKALLNELKALTAELKVYSVIQSQINATLSAKQGIRIDADGMNLFEPTLYGYTVGDAKWIGSPEYVLLSKLNNFQRKLQDNGGSVQDVLSVKLSIKDYLSGSPKQSGELKGLRDEYPFEKDNNPVGNFATTVSDRSRPLNDKVNEKTTLLNDTSSRYNSAVEALNRFIQKYDSVLRDILSAI
ncbi:virulence-associated V antigen [Pseudomonas aeruginosa]|uniref:virulence-associated V antigen n=1 Tax=Pseudomonas aeruginosa TaxID=287 RepID=UPI003F36C08D